MATPRLPSSTNVFIPQATGLAIAFVNDPSNFAVNRYVQVTNAPKPVVLYAFLDPDAPVRVVSDAEFDWPWDQKRPEPAANIGNFKWEEVRVFRRDYGYMIGEETVDNAEGWNPKAFFNSIVLSLAMVNMTKRVNTLIETAANWGANTATATALNGGAGTWEGASNDEGSVKFLAIKKSLNKAMRRIRLASNGMVKKADIRLRLSPETADMISETAEIHTYIEKSPHALAQIKGDAPNVNDGWSLPEKLYGFDLVIEDATNVTVRPNADGTVATLETEKTFIADRTKAALVARPGALHGNYGSPSFSTVQRYVHKYEMAVEARHDPWNHIYESHVVDAFKEVLAAPQSGYLITGVMS